MKHGEAVPFFVMQKHCKHKKCAISSPLWATGNDVQKLHGLVFAHYCGAVLVQEVLCSIVKLIQVEAERNMQFVVCFDINARNHTVYNHFLCLETC